MRRADTRRLLEEEAKRAERDEVREDAEFPYRQPPPAREPSQVYSIRIPVQHLKRLRELAEQRDELPTSMLRAWILERLDAEESQPGTVTVRVPPQVCRLASAQAERLGVGLDELVAQALAFLAGTSEAGAETASSDSDE